MKTLLEAIEKDQKLDLDEIESNIDAGLEEDPEALAELVEELDRLQDLMFADGQHGLLVVLQGRDTGGKDGTIKGVFSRLGLVGCRIASFKVPSEEELQHDFLWRVHKQVPHRGETVIFNRSHYEDVLVVRVHELVDEKVWSARFEQINDFEKILTKSGVIVVKFFLHISKKEQEKRLRAREEKLEKAWKLSAGDWREREFWDAYTAANGDALSRCSTGRAPWYVVPADKKWFRNLAVAQTLVETLRPYEADWTASLERLGKKRLAEIKKQRGK